MNSKSCIILLFLLLLSTVAVASEFAADEGTIVSKREVVDDDLYLFGNFCEVYGKVTGDLTCFCYRITNEGEIEKSANMFANIIECDGHIGNSARIFGKYIDIFGNIKKNLLAFGREITLGKKVTIGKDINCYGEVVTIDGTVKGNAHISAGSVVIS